MSYRSRRARVLAGALTRSAGVSVVARYDRDLRGYVIEWCGGPDEQEMREVAKAVAESFPDFDLEDVQWRRVGEGSVPMPRRGMGPTGADRPVS